MWEEVPPKKKKKAESEEDKSKSEKRKKWRLNPAAVPYTDSASDLKRNHPLMIMVNEKRTDLLGHPVCMALIRNKWNKFGRQGRYSIDQLNEYSRLL